MERAGGGGYQRWWKIQEEQSPVKKTLDFWHSETEEASGSKVTLSKVMTLTAKLKDSVVKGKQHLYTAVPL